MEQNSSTSLSPRYRVPRTLADPPSPRELPRFNLSPRLLQDSNRGSESQSKTKYSVLKGASAPTSCKNTYGEEKAHSSISSKGIHLRGELGTNTTLQQYPFSLIQVHRDAMGLRAGKDSRRGIKCFLRLCGSMSSGIEAKAAAEAQLCNSAIKLKKNNLGDKVVLNTIFYVANIFSGTNQKSHRNRAVNGIEWKRFDGFENMPFQHTDHFIVICRSVPVEYASFTPTCDLMEVSFPPSCKLRSQKYSCVSVNDFKKHNTDGVTTDNPDVTDALMPLYSREMACVSEIHAVTHTKVECLRFAVLAMNSDSQPSNTNLLVVPLYSWLVISEELTTSYSCSEYLSDSSMLAVNERIEREGKYMNSKTATEELRVALQGFGVGSASRYQNPDDGEASLRDASRNMLRRDLRTRKLMEEVDKRFASNIQKSKDSRDGRNQTKRTKAVIAEDKKPNVVETEAERKAAIAALIEARSRIISLNDELCIQERNLKVSGEIGNDKQIKPSRLNKSAGSAANGVGRKRVEVLEALQTIPNMKTMKVRSDQFGRIQSSRVAPPKQQNRTEKESAAERRQNRIMLPYLKNKLDLIDDIVFVENM